MHRDRAERWKGFPFPKYFSQSEALRIAVEPHRRLFRFSNTRTEHEDFLQKTGYGFFGGERGDERTTLMECLPHPTLCAHKLFRHLSLAAPWDHRKRQVYFAIYLLFDYGSYIMGFEPLKDQSGERLKTYKIL